MQLNIRLFAGLAEALDESLLAFQVPALPISAKELKEQLAAAYPAAASLLAVSFVAVNQEYAAEDQLITEHDEVAIIPPVSGGDGSEPGGSTASSSDSLYIITEQPLSVDEVTAKVIDANHGATLTFVGTTREMTGYQQTVHLEYEAYVPMALKQLQLIGQEIDERWPGSKTAISHRIGKVDIKEISVIIAVSAPHRESCYEASRYAIEKLKQSVPIWKKEIWADGAEWKGHQQGPWNPHNSAD